MSEHVHDVTGKLKVLHSCDMCGNALGDVYRSVVLAKVLYASPAWWRFTTASDKQRIDTFVCRGDLNLTQLVEDANETLFRTMMYNQQHALHQFFPDVSSHHYSLWS